MLTLLTFYQKSLPSLSKIHFWRHRLPDNCATGNRLSDFDAINAKWTLFFGFVLFDGFSVIIEYLKNTTTPTNCLVRPSSAHPSWSIWKWFKSSNSRIGYFCFKAMRQGKFSFLLRSTRLMTPQEKFEKKSKYITYPCTFTYSHIHTLYPCSFTITTTIVYNFSDFYTCGYLKYAKWSKW